MKHLHKSDSSLIVRIARRAGPLIVVSAIIFVGFFGSHWLLPSDSAHGDAQIGPTASNSPVRLVVRMTSEKEAAGRLHTAIAAIRELTPIKTVPGVVKYNATKHVQLRSPVECVVKKSLVQVGQWVRAGQQLAILTSPDVGLARNQVKKCQADLKLARLESEWAEMTYKNLQDLLTLLPQDPSVADVEAELEGKVLGDHRNELVSAYSQYLLARNVVSRSTSLESSGTLSGRVIEQRKSDREVAAAKFKGVCEETKFQSQKDRVKAAADVEAGERALDVCHDKLQTLLGPYGVAGGEAGHSDFELKAPMAGRIEELATVESMRFQVGESMIVLADTKQVWVAAQIHQRNWKALQVATGQTLSVSIPALPDREILATVKFVGATVSPSTLAVPLIASVENTDDTLRPGMFVWVDVPISTTRRVLTVPVSAVQRQEGQAFVFVKDAEHTYRRVDVDAGIETPLWIEIAGGLAEGDTVVDEGAFYLTSELLLEEE